MTQQKISLSQPVTETMQVDDYLVKISNRANDDRWDTFLMETPEGHHVQTSLWGQLKEMLGWRALRFTISCQDGSIVGGAQMLIRRHPMIGNIGILSKGPVLGIQDRSLSTLITKELLRITRACRIHLLVVQPPEQNSPIIDELPYRGFIPAAASITPTATTVLDLSRDIGDILANMKGKTRYNIRHGQRKGVTVRLGDEADLGAYYDLLTATSQRQKFSKYPREYYEKMWEVFQPHRYLNLFLAEFQGEVVSAQLAVTFGDTVLNKLSVWSGNHGKFRPNEVLQWSVIEWAKTNGYRYYDFEGIEAEAAQAVVENRQLPESLHQSVSTFKLGFGGEIKFFPGAYIYISNQVLCWMYGLIFPRMVDSSLVKSAMSYLRTH